MRTVILNVVLIIAMLVAAGTVLPSSAYAHPCRCGGPCACGPTCGPKVSNCSTAACECQSEEDTPKTIEHTTNKFIQHREWLIKIFWEAHILPAMMLMTEHMSTVAMQQAQIIGTFFDAKEQLEAQRMLQEMQAQAHKDYHPSEGMCDITTSTLSLGASDRNSDISQIALAARNTQRQLLNADGIGGSSKRDDIRSRWAQFKTTYCNPEDMGMGLDLLCKATDRERFRKDIDFTKTIANEYTIELDFSNGSVTFDEQDVLALGANLYGPNLMPRIPEDKIAKEDGTLLEGAKVYMDMRALTAKRSVAQAAFAAQVAMRSEGKAKSRPYLIALLTEMGIEEPLVEEMLGEKPSYYAQMELLTKKLYQTPNFYTELYDKPSNIDRKIVSLQAIGLMQKRDMYRSRIRSEAIASVWLETMLKDIEDFYFNEAAPMRENTEFMDLPGY